ncbi:MAG: HAD hydrolase-like protein [Gammaproteobacteria bacterium]|nr:HAD hydrolase-like protein [Gammaproteobacteria bacterium]
MNLLFDLDGTLTDSAAGIVNSIAHAMRELGRTPPPSAVLRDTIGLPIKDTFEVLLQGPERADEAVRIFRARYGDVGLFENRVYEHIPGMLEALSDHTLYVATSKVTVYATRILEHFGLAPRFEHIFGAELGGRHADKRELVRYAIEQEDLDPAATAMIGDTEFDIAAGRANNLTTIGVTWGYGTALHDAAHIVDSPDALPKLIASLVS